MTQINLTSPADITLKTAGKYCEEDIEVVQALEEREATPSDVEQEFTPTSGSNGIGKFVVRKTPTQQVVVKSTEQETTVRPADGMFIDTIVVSPIKLQGKVATPTKEIQTIVADAEYDAIRSVTLGSIPEEYIIPEGNIDITENQVVDVTQYSQATINVPTGSGGEDLIGSMLQGISVDYVDTSGIVTSVKSNAMYGKNTYLNSVELPKCSIIGNTAFFQPSWTVTTIPSDFTGLKKVSLPLCTKIEDYAFVQCYNLSDVFIPKVETMGNHCFRDCVGIKFISAPGLVSVGSAAFSNCYNLTQFFAPNLSYIGSKCFYSVSNMSEYSFPELSRIEESAFFRNTALVSFNAPKLRGIGQGAFASCSNLSVLNIDYDNLTTLAGQTFMNCYLLESFIASQCRNVGGSAFFNCSALSIVSFPNVTTVDAGAFVSCKLNNIDLPMCSKVGTSAFQNCRLLSVANLPLVQTLSSGAFAGCSALISISCPSVTAIYSYVFQNCYTLPKAEFPILNNIRANAFTGCSSLSALILPGTTIATLSASNAFASTPMQQSSYLGYWGSIYVPADLVDGYKAATNWTYYSDRITSIDNLPAV